MKPYPNYALDHLVALVYYTVLHIIHDCSLLIQLGVSVRVCWSIVHLPDILFPTSSHLWQGCCLCPYGTGCPVSSTAWQPFTL